MRRLVVRNTFPVFLVISAAGVLAGPMDITSDCGGPCTSITYSGGPGNTATGLAIGIDSNNGRWVTLGELGLQGAWISYAATGLSNTGPMAGQIVDFNVNYAINPSFVIGSITINVLADDFAQLVTSPQNIGPLPGWQVDVGAYCSKNPPGCLASTLYTYKLNASQIASFASDNLLTFSVLQLVDNTPFGLAFDIQISAPEPTPEPASLGLAGLGIGAAVILRRSRLFARLRS